MTYVPVFILHHNPKTAQSIRRCLEEAGYATQRCADLKGEQPDFDCDQSGLLIADEQALCPNGQSIYDWIKSKPISSPVILLSEKPTVRRAVKAIKMGASDYLSTPVDQTMLIAAVAKAHANQTTQHGNIKISSDSQRLMITHSESMLNMLSMAQKIAGSPATVLIQGESGTGKELLARYIHQSSNRKRQPFVAMNCAALPDNLVESELFGYEKGAFTGAGKTRQGKFEQAHKGTLLLDEISEMPLSMQAKLLRVLQEKEVDHLGGGKPIGVDVRCIATSNQDLSKMVTEGRFRKDLYYRLRVIPLMIPPLRDRKEDIPLLLTHFIGKYHSGNGASLPRFDDIALELMQQWNWPGNVRELENTVERALLISSGPVIGKASLYLEQDLIENNNEAPDALVGMTVKELEKKLIGETLSHLNQNRTHAAKMLGISIRTLRNKLRDYQEQEGSLNPDLQGKQGLVR